MNDFRATICDAVQEASFGRGQAVEPTALLDVIAESEKPMDALCKSPATFFDAINQDFPYINVARNSRVPLGPMEREQVVCLFRWLIMRLAQWRSGADASENIMVAAFVVAQACDWDCACWKMAPDDIGANVELNNRLELLIGSFAVGFTSIDPSRTPLWEIEAVERLQSLEIHGDWAALGDAWMPFAQRIQPTAIHNQAVRCLYRSDVTQLASALVNLRQVAVGMMVASTLATNEKLNLAVVSDNPYVQFCCLYQVLADYRAEEPMPSHVQKQLLTTLLLKVATDALRWAGWMQAFNAYPMRHPALQAALGIALARAPEAAIEAYVNSIVLYPKDATGDPGREAVATCLRAFHSEAALLRRKALWSRAHERWTTWDFNRIDPSQHLFKIQGSELDFAIVGYACECLDTTGRSMALESINARLQALEDTWYESITDIATSSNRLLSTFQPYAHAVTTLASEGDWLSRNVEYWPEVLAQNEYKKIRYRLTE